MIEAHYGGPDLPPRALRDLLKAQVEAAPPGSEILWATYYFRDRDLAEALVAARRRGVRVRVALDARPRQPTANRAVVETLRTGLGDGLRLHRPIAPGSRLHAKIYAFSGPTPRVFVGSFNPSGDEREDRDILARIGDQDRGHNLLVQFRDPAVVGAVRAHAERIWRGQGDWRFSPRQNAVVRLSGVSLYYFPRVRTDMVEAHLAALGRGDHVRAAISHLGPGALTSELAAASRRGVRVELVVHDTRRRAPDAVVAGLARAGVAVRRYCHPDGLPMHAKFIVVRRGPHASAWFGSLNHNLNSRLLNQEILVRSGDPGLVRRLDARFVQIEREAIRFAADGGTGPLPILAPDRTCGAQAGAEIEETRGAAAPLLAAWTDAVDWLQNRPRVWGRAATRALARLAGSLA